MFPLREGRLGELANIKARWTSRNASIYGGEVTLWVIFCRATSPPPRLLYPTKRTLRRAIARDCVGTTDRTWGFS